MQYKPLSSIFYSNNNEYLKIYTNRYNSESTYRFNFKIKENNAFLIINNDILRGIESIYKLNCDLLKKVHRVPLIALKQYRKKCLVDEIKITNEIEGVNSTRKEINDILNSKVENNKNTRLYGLVKKYDLLEEEEIKLNCCEDIRELYNELVLKEVIEEDSKNKPDGKIFRKEEVYVQNPTGKIIHSGVYPEENIIFNMTKGLNILNNDEYGYMIRIAVFHYIFGYIHPFYDGNGRTSRFISSYLLSKNLHPLVSYKLASTIKENLNSYYKSFKETNDEKNKGDLTIFVIKFFDILIKSLMELCDSLDEGYSKLNYFTNISEKMCVGDSRKFKVLFILIQNTLFGDEGLDIDDLSSICKIGKSKIRSSLKELEENNILYITKDGRKNLYDVNLNYMSNLNENIKKKHL